MAAFQKFIIYYFSGTGNSRNVAVWLSDTAAKHGIESQIFNIAEFDRHAIEKPSADALVIFISPVHGFNYPPLMLNFITCFPKGNNKVLLMNTRAGMLIGKFITPGLSGLTFYFASLVLKLKGYSITGMVPINMPSNWIFIHPGLNDRTIKYLHEKNKERVHACIEKIISGKKDLRALREIIVDIIISPISVLYYIIGRFGLSKTYFTSSDCNDCDICIRNCPVKAIIKIDNRPYWTFKCESCMRCMGNCPRKAIETGHGFFIGVYLIYSLVIGVFYNFFNLPFSRIENNLMQFVIETAVFLSLLAVSYRLVHYLMRFKTFERLMVYTSLTKYKFWGRRYRALKEK